MSAGAPWATTLCTVLPQWQQFARRPVKSFLFMCSCSQPGAGGRRSDHYKPALLIRAAGCSGDTYYEALLASTWAKGGMGAQEILAPHYSRPGAAAARVGHNRKCLVDKQTATCISGPFRPGSPACQVPAGLAATWSVRSSPPAVTQGGCTAQCSLLVCDRVRWSTRTFPPSRLGRDKNKSGILGCCRGNMRPIHSLWSVKSYPGTLSGVLQKSQQ